MKTALLQVVYYNLHLFILPVKFLCLTSIQKDDRVSNEEHAVQTTLMHVL